MLEKTYQNLHYYEHPNHRPPLVLLHAQGVDSTSFRGVIRPLSRRFHIYAIDCFGHGKSAHDPALYNLTSMGDAVIGFIRNVVGGPVCLVGHSSGGLIAAYVAARSDLCRRLFLEDPPFFASQGERRRSTFNYIDLSAICHAYNTSGNTSDFVLYYFRSQYAWNFFPDKSRDKLKARLVAWAETHRRKHPDRDLRVPFWPKAGFLGMNRYDPRFGETFYDDSFHCGIPHEDLLRHIQCPTVFMKARTNYSDDGTLLAALSEEDLQRVQACIPDCKTVRFHCGHGIHSEKPRAFVRNLWGA